MLSWGTLACIIGSHMKYILISTLIIILSFQACRLSEDDENISKAKELIADNDFISDFDTLKISANFDELGEFGGHKEEVHIFYVKGKLYAQLLITNVPKISGYPNPNYNRKIIEQKSFLLDHKDKNLIISYLQKLLSKSLLYKVSSNAGKNYTAVVGNSVLLNYHHDGSNWIEYDKLKAELNKKRTIEIPSYIDKNLHGKLFSIEGNEKKLVSYSLHENFSSMSSIVRFINLNNKQIYDYLLIDLNNKSSTPKNITNGFLVYKDSNLTIGDKKDIDSLKKYGVIKVNGNLFYHYDGTNYKIERILIEENNSIDNSKFYVRSYKEKMIVALPEEYGSYVFEINNNQLKVK